MGSEMDGSGVRYSRPVLIIKKTTPNTCLCIPLTTKQGQGSDFVGIDLGDGVLRKAILSQIKLIDTKRLREIIAVIDYDQFQKIKRAVVDMLEEPLVLVVPSDRGVGAEAILGADYSLPGINNPAFILAVVWRRSNIF